MTHAISVPTPFNDISELAENFASRVDEERLMLPHDQAIPAGEWVEFAVLLGDGTPALSGVGRCSDAYDNGEDRAPEHRFDIVLEALQLEEMAQVYFDRIVMARQAQGGAEPATGEVELAPELDASAPDAALSASDDEWEAHSAEQLPLDDAEPTEAWEEPKAAPPARAVPALPSYPASPPVKPGELPSPHSNGGGVLLRPSLHASWSPEPVPRPDPRPSSGLFNYGSGGLPQPAQPPRPDIHPSATVKRAPRPGDRVEMPFAPQAAYAEGAVEEHDDSDYSVEMDE